MKLYLRLLRFARPYIFLMLLSVVCMLVVSLCSAAIAYLVKPAIDGVFIANTPQLTMQHINDWDALLHTADTPAGTLLLQELAPATLAALRKCTDSRGVSPTLRADIVAAINRLCQRHDLYPQCAHLLTLTEDSPAGRMRADLVATGLLQHTEDTGWQARQPADGREKTRIEWFNIAVLRQLYPGVIGKPDQRDLRLLYAIPLLVIIAYLLKGAADFGQAYCMGAAGNRTIADIRDALYRHLQDLSVAFFSRTPTGILMARISNDVDILQRAVSDALKRMLQSILLIVCLTGVAFYQNWRLALACMVLLPVVATVIAVLGRKGKSYSRRSQERLGRLATFLDETISGCRTVKAFCMEQYENKRFVNESARLFRINLRDLRIGILTSPLMEILGGLMGAAIIYYGGYQIIHGQMTTGQFSSFLAALAMLYRPIKMVGRENIKIQRGMAAAVRVFAILDEQPQITDKPDAITLPPMQQAIDFTNVSFSYGEEPVLRNITCRVRAGESIALVGHSGAGKTTLANLLLRFYDVTGGSISIDGIDIRDVTIASLRRQIAYVTQESILFDDTVRNNIAHGNAAITDDIIEQAARAAHAHDFITALPDGYDTVIGEKGARLSGGQRQRIAIARALVKDAPILILDEATSALDAHSEQLVQQALENLMHNRTTLIIAHRLATVRAANTILVLENGRIIEQGSHQDLMTQSGIYTHLVHIQSAYGATTQPEPSST